MIIRGPLGNAQGFWLTPAIFGAALIAAGVLIYLNPNLLAYFVAGLFVLGGVAMLGVAWQMRGRVTYRRFDEHRNAPDGSDERL
ncbi:MAG: hypothetical protein KKB50_17805 [Planctomycetes bacterium]|nr:hypothetical protein [Planctomycetota bacterium]